MVDLCHGVGDHVDHDRVVVGDGADLVNAFSLQNSMMVEIRIYRQQLMGSSRYRGYE